MELVWLGLFVFFLLVEGLTAAITSLWFAIGALAALVGTLLGVPLPWQIIVFLILSAASLLLLRPFAMKVLKVGEERTNADVLLDTEGVVLIDINNTTGQGEVQVRGQIWSARGLLEEHIPKGSRVIVRQIQGVRLYVEQVTEKEEA
ncbi:MAG TPA: NfeD family protein [Clostridiales bacterium]|jgi:membrane protein implicated in regulation of membrane protease activity|nr:NfeD family protein [Clostridiales bacterium]